MLDSSNIWNFLLICSDKFAYNEWVSSTLGQPFQPRWPLALGNSMDSCWVFHSIRIYCHIQISISLKNRQTLTNADVKRVQCLLTRVKAQLTNQPWGTPRTLAGTAVNSPWIPCCETSPKWQQLKDGNEDLKSSSTWVIVSLTCFPHTYRWWASGYWVLVVSTTGHFWVSQQY